MIQGTGMVGWTQRRLVKLPTYLHTNIFFNSYKNPLARDCR